jgi:hypothetical protein
MARRTHSGWKDLTTKAPRPLIKAGNVGNGSASFTITVTSASLINLVNLFETKPV